MLIGLTGGIASGKSTVSQMLADLGAVIIDADQLARDVVAPGTPGLAAVVAEFGPQVVTATGEMDRARVGEIVFADPARRAALEAIIWPLVGERSRTLAQEAPDGALVVHDIPLLVETDQQGTFDAVIVVDVPRETQIERMIGDRGMTRAEAESRIAAQLDRESRLAAATFVIENTGSREDLRHRVTQVFREITKA